LLLQDSGSFSGDLTITLTFCPRGSSSSTNFIPVAPLAPTNKIVSFWISFVVISAIF
jgi:hypothetical protein